MTPRSFRSILIASSLMFAGIVGVAVSVGPGAVRSVLAQIQGDPATQRAPVHYALYGIQPALRLNVDLQSPAEAAKLANLTNASVLQAIVTGVSGDANDSYYTWSVRKKTKDGQYEKFTGQDDVSAEIYNKRIQAFAALPKDCKAPQCLSLQSGEYGDLVLIDTSDTALHGLVKYSVGPRAGNPDEFKWLERLEDTTTTTQYFARLAKDANGNYSIAATQEAYNKWAKANGIGNESPLDDHDKDGFQAKYGGNAGEYGVGNDPGKSVTAYWDDLRANWQRTMCGTSTQETITIERKGNTCTIVSGGISSQESSRYYCREDNAELSFLQPGTHDKLTEAACTGLEYVDIFGKINEGRNAKAVFTCGASQEFSDYWRDSWRQYNDKGEIKQDRSFGDAYRDCINASKGEYQFDAKDNYYNLTNCFEMDPATEREHQQGCYHTFPGVQTALEGTPRLYETGGSDNAFTNWEEFVWGTNPTSSDTDADGVVDEGDIVGHRQSQLSVPIDQLREIPVLNENLDEKLRERQAGNSGVTLSKDEGARYEFRVDVEGKSNVAQRMPDPANPARSVKAFRNYHVSDTFEMPLDLQSQIQTSGSVRPTFPNIHEATKFIADLSLQSLGSLSPGSLYYKWFRIENGQRGSAPSYEGYGTDGAAEFSLNITETGQVGMAADMYAVDPVTGALKYVGSKDFEANVLPGIELSLDSPSGCYIKGTKAKITPKTQTSNGELFYTWYVDNQLAKTTDTGLNFDPTTDPLAQGKKATDDILVNDDALELSVEKDAPGVYVVKLAYSSAAGISGDPSAPAIAQVKVLSCDPVQGTVINIDNPGTSFNYRAGQEVRNSSRALAKPGTKAELSPKLDPTLANISDLTYQWSVKKNRTDVSGVSNSTNRTVSFTLEGNPDLDEYDVSVTISSTSNAFQPITANLNIALVRDTGATPAAEATPRPTNLDSLIQNLANFRTLTISRAIETIFRLGLIATALAALVMVIIAGNEYFVAAASGNVGLVTEARERVTSAILGLIIAFGSWILLNIINPDLLQLRNPAIQNLLQGTTTTQQTIPPAGSAGGQSAATATAGAVCTITNGKDNCVAGYKCVAETPAPGAGAAATPVQKCFKECANDAACPSGMKCTSGFCR